MQHLSSYNYQLLFRPELLFGEPFQYQNRIAAEFNHLYHWHPLMPSAINISGHEYAFKDYMFHSEIVIKHGMATVLDSMVKQRAGLVSLFCLPVIVVGVIVVAFVVVFVVVVILFSLQYTTTGHKNHITYHKSSVKSG